MREGHGTWRRRAVVIGVLATVHNLALWLLLVYPPYFGINTNLVIPLLFWPLYGTDAWLDLLTPTAASGSLPFLAGTMVNSFFWATAFFLAWRAFRSVLSWRTVP